MPPINYHVAIEIALFFCLIWLLRKKATIQIGLWDNAIYWKLAIWKFVNGVVKVGIASFLGGTAAQNWETLNPGEKTVVILTTLLSMQTFIDGFLDQTLTKLDSKKVLSTPPPPPTVPTA